MKKKTILLIGIIILIAVFAWFIYTKAVNKKNNNDSNNEKEIVELSTTMQNLYSKLMEEANKIIKSEDYLKFNKKDDIYFISLDDLNLMYDFDITSFVDEYGNACDTSNSGIYFDVDNKLYEHDKSNFAVTTLIGCGFDNNTNVTIEEKDKTIVANDNQYVVSLDSTTTAIFEYDNDEIKKYLEYYENDGIDFDVFKDTHTNKYIKSITNDNAYFIIEYNLKYLDETYNTKTLSGIKAYYGE